MIVSKVTVDVSRQRGIPVPTFTLHTHRFEQARQQLTLYRVALRTQRLKGDAIKLQWSLPDPRHSLPDLTLRAADVESLSGANAKAQAIAIVLSGSEGRFGKRQRAPVPGFYRRYFLDWWGEIEATETAAALLAPAGPLSSDQLTKTEQMIAVVVEKRGPITGLYALLGDLAHKAGATNMAVEYLEKEIRLSADARGRVNVGALPALTDLACMLGEMRQDDLAAEVYTLALQIDPNNYAALTGYARVADRLIAFPALARAYRVRTDNQQLIAQTQQLVTRMGGQAPEYAREIVGLAAGVDLRKAPSFLDPTLAARFLSNLDLPISEDGQDVPADLSVQLPRLAQAFAGLMDQAGSASSEAQRRELYAQAADSARARKQLCQRAGLDPLPAIRDWVRALIGQGAWDSALAACQEGLERVAGSGEREAESDLQWQKGQILVHQGDSAGALQAVSESARLLFQGGEAVPAADRLLEGGALFLQRGDLPAAERTLNAALQIVQRLDDPQLRLRALTALGEVDERRGNAEGALQRYREARALAWFDEAADLDERIARLGAE